MKIVPRIAATLITIAAFAAGAFAEDALRWIGAIPSHRSVEKYDMSVGVSPAQTPRRAERLEEDREVMNVPAHYGQFVGMTGDSAATVLWYRDAEGSLRNVVVREPAAKALKLVCVPTQRLETELRERR